MHQKIGTVGLLMVLAARAPLAAQSLAGLAQQEEERRKAIQAPARVISGKDLRPVAGPSPEARAAASAPPATPGSDTASAARDAVAVAPAQYLGGTLPEIPTVAISGGEVLLELTVGSDGRVTAVKPLRHTAPFTEALTAAVGTWKFRPAEDAALPKPGGNIDLKTRKPVASKVLVAALFRPPALYASTIGEPPKDVAAPSDEIPFPLTAATMPLYPPLAVAGGVTLAELRVAADGRLVGAKVIQSAPPFDGPTLDAVRAWAFRPSRVHGQSVSAFVYVVAGFRSPVTPSDR